VLLAWVRAGLFLVLAGSLYRLGSCLSWNKNEAPGFHKREGGGDTTHKRGVRKKVLTCLASQEITRCEFSCYFGRVHGQIAQVSVREKNDQWTSLN
jgi:hypothetical protein